MVPFEMAKQFLQERMVYDGCRMIHWYQGQYWIWNQKRYVPEDEKGMKRILMGWMKETLKGKVSRYTRDETLAQIEATLYTSQPQKMPMFLMPQGTDEEQCEFLLFKNGLFNLTRYISEGAAIFSKPTPRWFSGTILPVECNLSAEAPLWHQCLKEWMCGDETLIQILQEYAGYCLTHDTRYHVGLFLEGEGANGKNVFTDTLSYILGGSENCSAVLLDRFASEFALSGTLNKLVNFASETTGHREIPASEMKRYISGDFCSFGRKHLSDVTARPTAKLIISWNRRPPVTDDSDGFWRRILLVPWRAQFLGKRADPDLQMKLKREAAGVMRWALEGLRRLRKQHGFTRSEDVTSVTSSFREESDPSGVFLSTFLRFEKGKTILKETIFDVLADYCHDRGIKPPAPTVVMKRALRMFPGIQTGRKRLGGSTRVQVIEGLTWTDEGKALLARYSQ